MKYKILIAFVLLVTGCSKEKQEPKKNITVDAISFSIRTIGNNLRGVDANFMLNGEVRSISSDISPEPTSKSGELTFAANDFVADNSEIIPAQVSADQSRWIKNPNLNTISFIMGDLTQVQSAYFLDHSFASVTLKITKETTFVFSGERIYANYNLHQLDSAVKATAVQLPSLYAQNYIKRTDVVWGRD